MTTVLVVDDHPVYRRGIAMLLAASGFDVVGEAASAEEAVALAHRLRPEVVLMDLGLPDASGTTATARILGMHPEMKVVVVTMFDDDGSVREALRAGAAGYVVKDASATEIVAAVRAALLGAVVLGSGIAGPLGLMPTRSDVSGNGGTDRFGLTPRERQVLDLVTRGLTNRQIAERLGLSGKTVANNVSMVLAKLRVTDRYEAADRWRRETDAAGRA